MDRAEDEQPPGDARRLRREQVYLALKNGTIDGMEAKEKLTVLSHDGTQATLDASGKVTSDKVLTPKATAERAAEMKEGVCNWASYFGSRTMKYWAGGVAWTLVARTTPLASVKALVSLVH